MDAPSDRAWFARAAFALLAGVGGSLACAQGTFPTTTASGPTTTPAAVAAATSASPAQAGGLVIFKDPATGQWRDPDPAEIRALVPPARATGIVVQRALASGGYSVLLDESFDSFMVMTKGGDGNLAYRCVTPQELAAEASRAPVPAKATPVPAAAPVLRSFRELPDVQ